MGFQRVVSGTDKQIICIARVKLNGMAQQRSGISYHLLRVTFGESDEPIDALSGSDLLYQSGSQLGIAVSRSRNKPRVAASVDRRAIAESVLQVQPVLFRSIAACLANPAAVP